MGEAVEMIQSDVGVDRGLREDNHSKCYWYEEELDNDLKWSFALNRGSSEYQDIALLDTKHFGKALVIDGKMQSAEMDEFIYHECLIHPPLLCHPNPKTVFIMGGGEGSAAREIFRHKTIERVVMCDIDQDVVDFCRRYLTVNQQAFRNEKLQLVINDAKIELEKREEKFDVIVGDLADPVEGGPCYQLYTKSFYEKVLKPRLNHQDVLAYTAHVPSFADTWGWVMASDQPFDLNTKLIDSRIDERVDGELLYLNGASLLSSTVMNKSVHQSLLKETHVYTEDNARFIHGHGKAYSP
ncbi:thermospermine synthase ACAULIS5 [Cinnamomum micranthum f. kanehirae]|uniref:thermospermine synthase n=1 Tax=Cinnamomum micranthum f. kanehirae TaxID=337451 RepID=A0A3S3P8K1_9MAGN|nr:thermospermine synthase ACAULIS5 [Cinnamomum micranthum f. kanehirae]